MIKIKIYCAILLIVVTVGRGEGAETADSNFKRGWEFFRAHNLDLARSYFEQGLQKAPRDALAHYYLAEVCRESQDWSCAESHYRLSLELGPNLPEAEQAKTNLAHSSVWRILNDLEKANSGEMAPTTIKEAVNNLIEAAELGLDEQQNKTYQVLKKKFERIRISSHSDMAMIPKGEFVMGSDSGKQDETPQHRVSIDAFLIDKTEVTVAQYSIYLEETNLGAPPSWKIINEPTYHNYPIIFVDWDDASGFCKWARKRLPTEAEWEKAARGTDGRTFPWGNSAPTHAHSSFEFEGMAQRNDGWIGYRGVTPVGSLPKGQSVYGVYDMAGNVMEWVNDWYSKDYYSVVSVQNPTGPVRGQEKVARGGSSYDDSRGIRVTSRFKFKPTAQNINIGFRCAKTP